MMRAKEARNIPIGEFLERSGIMPAKCAKLGQELWYSSPLREGDSDPSFKVDTIKNLWFDFGLSRGGNIIDLVCELTNSTVKDALAILERNGSLGQAGHRTPLPHKSPTQTALFEKKTVAGEIKKVPKVSFEIVRISEIQDHRLLAYLAYRKIERLVADNYLKEIRYKAVGSEKIYCALGFPSGESFEIRSKNFKGSVGANKEISTLNLGNGKTLSIFEGFMDFLAFLSHYGITHFQNSVIILNSTNLKDRALEVIAGYEFLKVYLFLDNDEAGTNAKQFFIDHISGTPVIDKSALYEGYNDFNAMTMETSDDRNTKFE